MKTISIIGTGAYGLSIAVTLLKKCDNIKMWVESEERAKFLNENRSNNGIFNDFTIPDNIEFSNDSDTVKDEDYDSLILYIAKPGDSLWKIAKKFNSTVDELARMNGIENENEIIIGQKIYIPKFNYIKKENTENAREQVVV